MELWLTVRFRGSPAMKRLYQMLDVVAPTGLSVLILGETGVGKEVFAEALHRRSSRVGAPFPKLNCAALPESILEAELFGYEKGAFTGATQTKVGLFEAADGGTLFLGPLRHRAAARRRRAHRSAGWHPALIRLRRRARARATRPWGRWSPPLRLGQGLSAGFPLRPGPVPGLNAPRDGH